MESRRGSGFTVGGVNWAPLNVPHARRRQTFAVWFSLMLPFLCLGAAFVLIRSSGWRLLAFMAYWTYLVFFQTAQQTGGYPCAWYKRLVLWRWFRDYFPISLHKSCDLDPTQTYIFGYHPHGIISLGAILNFATEANCFSQLFPGIQLHLLTLAANFIIPFFHLHLGLLGICDASKETCNAVLGRGPGHAVMLVLGGAKESLDAVPGTYKLTLRNRKGFVKLALRNGSHLVPVFSFGETDIFDQVRNDHGSWLRRVQNTMQKQLGFALPLIKGRGVFNYSYGLLPFRRPICTVVGTPIPVPRVPEDDITPALVDEYHARYIEGLFQVYRQFKNKYGKGRTDSLEIVG